MSDKDFVRGYLEDFSSLIKPSDTIIEKIISVRDELVNASKNNAKIMIFGNGGSAAIASHVSVDLTKNAGIRCSNYNEADLITCFSNDYGYERWIEKAIDFYSDEKDVLILISYSGKTNELKNIIQYANRNKVLLIGIMSKKDSILYKASDIKLVIPEVKESGGIVPISSTTAQIALGDALAISAMQYKKFGKFDFKKFHPSGALGTKLKTVEDLMVTKNKLPLVYEYDSMKTGLKIIS